MNLKRVRISNERRVSINAQTNSHHANAASCFSPEPPTIRKLRPQNAVSLFPNPQMDIETRALLRGRGPLRRVGRAVRPRVPAAVAGDHGRAVDRFRVDVGDKGGDGGVEFGFAHGGAHRARHARLLGPPRPVRVGLAGRAVPRRVAGERRVDPVPVRPGVRLLVDGQLQLATRLRRAPARRAERVDGVAQLGRVLALPRVVVGAENLEEGLDVVLVVEQVAVAARALVPVSGGNRISGARLVPTYTRLLDGVKLDEGLSRKYSQDTLTHWLISTQAGACP